MSGSIALVTVRTERLHSIRLGSSRFVPFYRDLSSISLLLLILRCIHLQRTVIDSIFILRLKETLSLQSWTLLLVYQCVFDFIAHRLDI